MRGCLIFIFMSCAIWATAQDKAAKGLEKYAEPQGVLPWLTLSVLGLVAVVLIASLLFSKKKDYTK